MKKLIVLFLFFLSVYALHCPRATAGPIFPSRGFLLSPKWDTSATDRMIGDTTSVFDHAGYWAQVQRGIGSDSDRWGWSVTMGAIFEIARWDGNKSLSGFTGMELSEYT